MSEARSWYAGHFYLSDCPSPSPIKPNPKRNGPIHTESKTTHNCVSSAAETETYDTFNNRKTAIGMQPALITLDHEKPEIPLKIDNYMTEGFVSSGMKQKCSKKRDMIWHLLREKDVLEQLRVY